MTDLEHRQNALAIVTLDPNHPHTLWTGSHRMWRTRNAGHHWEHKSPVLDGSGITTIEVAGTTVFAGTSRGGIFRSEDGGDTWSGDISGPEIPAKFIGRITTHPLHPKRVVVAVAGSGIVSALIPKARADRAYLSTGTDETICHVFYSEDNGETWRSIDPADMPDVACHAAVFETDPPHRLFVSNDCGVWMTANLQDWKNITGTLPNVMVSDLVYHAATRALYAATYGRGLWRLALPAAGEPTTVGSPPR
jgi:photosystem II stability/assembly factor-like uncharacterized protein